MLRGLIGNIFASVANALQLGSQVFSTGSSAALTSASPYRTIINSASAFSVALPSSPSSNDTRVIANVGAGTVTVTGTFRTGTSVTIAQDNSRTFAWNSTLAYWTQE